MCAFCLPPPPRLFKTYAHSHKHNIGNGKIKLQRTAVPCLALGMVSSYLINLDLIFQPRHSKEIQGWKTKIKKTFRDKERRVPLSIVSTQNIFV